MIRWRAVGFGVVVEALLAFFGVLVPVLGHAAVGVAGGFVAGLLAARDASIGLRHGWLAGLGGALVSLALLVVLVATVGLPAAVAPSVASVVPLLTTLPVSLLGLVVLVATSALGGLGGGAVSALATRG